MSKYGTVGGLASLETVFVEAAEADTLEELVNEALVNINGLARVVTAMTLAGAGDGHTFTVVIQSALFDDVSGGLPAGDLGINGTAVRCYLAGDAGDLAPARLAAGVPDPIDVGQVSVPYVLVDEQLAGASKGRRIMGMSVYSIGSFPINAESARIVAVVTADQSLSAGDNILTFSGTTVAQQFSLADSQTIRYDGAVPIALFLSGSVVVEQDAAGDVTVSLVTDPLGNPQPLNSITVHIGNGEFEDVALPSWGFALPPGVELSTYGIQVTADGGGTVQSGLLRILVAA